MAIPIRSHKFRSKRFKIHLVNRKPLETEKEIIEGLCDPPGEKGKTIKIWTKVSDKDLLDVLIHEGIHAGIFDLDEISVKEISSDIARLILRIFEIKRK